MTRNPILDLPLTAVMRSEIALPLQFVLHIPTVGSLLKAWRSPKNQKSIEQLFDSPEQARHAVAVCAAWLGVQTAPSSKVVSAWWQHDERPAMDA
jgi:hypothetical protein